MPISTLMAGNLPVAGLAPAQIPAPPAGALESWLLSAAVVLSLLALGRKALSRPGPEAGAWNGPEEFRALRAAVESELGELRERLDARLLPLAEQLRKTKDELLEAGERRRAAVDLRLGALEAGLARLDERTRDSGRNESLRSSSPPGASRS